VKVKKEMTLTAADPTEEEDSNTSIDISLNNLGRWWWWWR